MNDENDDDVDVVVVVRTRHRRKYLGKGEVGKFVVILKIVFDGHLGNGKEFVGRLVKLIVDDLRGTYLILCRLINLIMYDFDRWECRLILIPFS